MNHNIGTVTFVDMSKVLIEISDISDISYNENGFSYFYDGINTYVTLIGIDNIRKIYHITRMYEKDLTGKIDENARILEKYIFEAEPLGELIGEKFYYGIENYPLLGDKASITSEKDLNLVLNSGSVNIVIGKLAQKNIYPKIDVDSLFSNHCCVLGNSGSGKSTTVKTILHKVHEKINNDEFLINKVNMIVFDFHGEYDYDTNNLNIDVSKEISIDLEELDKDDWINLVHPSEQVQLPVLLKSLKIANYLGNDGSDEKENSDWIRVFFARQLFENVQTDANAKKSKIQGILKSISDKRLNEASSLFNDFGSFKKEDLPKFEKLIDDYVFEKSGLKYDEVLENLDRFLEAADYNVSSLSDLEYGLEMAFLIEESRGNSQLRSYSSSLVTRIENLRLNYSDNLFSDDPIRLTKFKNIFSANNKYKMIVLNLSEFGDLDLKFISKYLMSYLFKLQQNIPIESRNLYNIILDEAHRYIGNDIVSEDNIFETVAKEGRKFGIFLFIISQRPSELSSTVLSQCNNFFIHRIRNNVDLEFIKRSIPFLDNNNMTRISFLKTGISLCVGESFHVPIELEIEINNELDKSYNIVPSRKWIKKINE